MRLIDDLLESIAQVDCAIKRVCVALHWTVVESKYTGMAHTYKTGNKVELESSGNLIGKSALEVALRLRNWEPLEASLGLAALNSLIEPVGNPGNVFEHILRLAAGKIVTVIGRFPSNKQIAQVAGRVHFLEMSPQGEELPSYACEEVIPESDVVVITATALINKTLARLLELSGDAAAIVLGPSTPMNDVLFRHGADILAGVRVVDTDALISSIAQGVKKFNKLAGVEPITQLSADR